MNCKTSNIFLFGATGKGEWVLIANNKTVKQTSLCEKVFAKNLILIPDVGFLIEIKLWFML